MQEISILSKDKSYWTIKYFLLVYHFQRLSKPVDNRALCLVGKGIYQANMV